RPHANADRGPDGQSVAGHGGDGRNQNRLAPDPELSVVAIAPLPQRHVGRAVRRLAGKTERASSVAFWGKQKHMLNVLTLGYAHIMSMQNTEPDVIVNVTSRARLLKLSGSYRLLRVRHQPL